LPVRRGAADAAIDDELMRLLRNFGIEVVHQHAQRRFGLPALGRKLRTARRSDQAGVVETRGHGGIIQYSIADGGRIGLDPTSFSGHSLRPGFLTSAARRGALIFKMIDVSRASVGKLDPD